MATRNFVPRADGEGKLGTPSKKWRDVYATTIHGSLDGNASSATIATDATNDADGNPISSTYVKKDSDYLGYRQPSTAYTTGAMAYHAAIPTGWYLECTTAGTTGSGTLTITSPTVGGMVSDGTVTWTIRKNASTQDLTGYLPLSGGAMTGGAITVANNSTGLSIRGASSWEYGAGLELYGKDNPDSNNKGVFRLYAKADNLIRLAGTPSGVLTWNGNSLDKSAVVAESLGVNGYRKYASGLIEQWGKNGDLQTAENGYVAKITYPISFTHEPLVTVSDNESYTNFITHRHTVASVTTDSLGNNVNPLTQLWVAKRTSTDGAVISSGNVCWHAIGY